ncbi:hypothetical protein [Caballeronia glebae]|uniref:hypothetical protein n=1 Tax=Caballeronia glebae TaxID=1777143 RepID=UPI000A9E39E7|nr:hypothetical protein [Caballeronia glebae]
MKKPRGVVAVRLFCVPITEDSNNGQRLLDRHRKHKRGDGSVKQADHGGSVERG